MNINSFEYGILIKGCTYADLRAVFPLGENGCPILDCEDHAIESRDVNGDEHYVSFGELIHGNPIPKPSDNVKYWINEIKASIAGVTTEFCVLEIER